MKNFAAVILLLLFVPAEELFSVEAITDASHYAPDDFHIASADSGGPDEYGYTWVDNNDPGGPQFEWVDISSIGTPVAGLADDNSVGPFSIGFDFPYYWYTVDRYYIGSNGWISFSSEQNFAHPFCEFPNPAPPNDLLGCLAGDLDFTRGGTCFYYTSAGLDSCVVSWIAVPEFRSQEALHTCQIILTRADSTITFQYGEQTGNFSAGGSDAFSMGIENLTGIIGLSYFYNDVGSTPPDPPPFADSTVIKFRPPDSTSYVVHDVGIESAFTSSGKGIFIDPAFSLPVWSDLRNFGNQIETLYGASCLITDTAGAIIYSDTVLNNAPIAPSETVNFSFLDPFSPGSPGCYSASFRGHLPLYYDMVPGNDELLVQVTAFRYPGELAYDDGVSDHGLGWLGDFSGFGNEYVPPLYPTVVEYAKVAIDNGGDLVVYVCDDDGPEGGPGTVLAGDTVTVSSGGWTSIDFSTAGIVIEDGGFFIGAICRFMGTFTFGMDESPPLSRRAWEITGGAWAPSRDLSKYDIMIRAGVNFLSTVENARADEDGDFVPDLLDAEVLVTGVMTGAASQFGTDQEPVFFQDGTGGIGLVSAEDDSIPEGTEIIVKATIGQSDGLTILTDPTILHVVTYGAQLPEVTEITAADLADTAGESFEGLFARLSRVQIIPESSYPGEGEDGSILVVDESGDTAVVFIDADTDIDGSATPYETALVIRGVVSQSTQSVPAYAGYMIMPRELADIEFAAGIEGGEGSASLPVAYSLSQNYPNPFNPETTVSFDIPEGAPEGTRVVLSIYSLRGQFVKTLLDGKRAPGTHRVTWNGKDEGGREVTSGVYLLRMQVGSERFVRKMIVLR